jgi:D-amino-acid dehydrogenase
MHVIVLGAGVIGVTTAYYLSQSGCEVTVVDRDEDVACGTSYANGGQLSYSFTDSLAKPEFFAQLPGLVLGRDPGSWVRMDAQLAGWGLRFLAQCTARRAARNTLALLDIALRSAELMAQLRNKVSLDFAHRSAGKLILLAHKRDLLAARKSCVLKQTHGCNTEILTGKEAAAIEPAIDSLSERYLGAVYSRHDDVADARLFTAGLRDYLESTRLARFRFDTEVAAIRTARNQFRAVTVADEPIEADACVVCAGVSSRKLLRPLGIRLPVYPVRGYSVTLPPACASPSVSITALRRRLLISRLGSDIRIAGFADFVGTSANDVRDGQRIAALLRLAERIAPHAADYRAAETHPWAGDRPMTPNGLPFVGPSRVKGLYLNTGHGMLGWTIACATSHDTARSIAQTD